MSVPHPVDLTDLTASPVLTLRSASIGYGERPVVHDVDLTLRRGEVMALVGANGSGKTTLVRGVLGLAQVVAGSVELFGTPAERFGERWRIGYVPQRHTVVGAIPSTVTEVVGSGRLPRRRWWSPTTPADRGAVERAIERVGLGELRTAPVANLSGGQQRRVLIARALAAEPEVLVMDEPTAGVDAEAQQRLVSTLETLVGQGLTMVVVTHEIAPLRPILTRAVLLHHGRVSSDLPAIEAFGPDAAPARAGLGGLGGGLDAGHDPEHTAGSPGAGWLDDPRLGG